MKERKKGTKKERKPVLSSDQIENPLGKCRMIKTDNERRKSGS